MRFKKRLLTHDAYASLITACTGLGVAGAQAQDSPALTGTVTAAEEGPIEGVLVSAKRDGGNVTVTVITDQKGEYSFPAARLDPGHYAISVRVAGYDLEGPKRIDVSAHASQADIKLVKSRNPIDELSNAEWLMSAPGPDGLKTNLTNCVGCHTLERVFTSTHDANEFKQVFNRMGTYSPGSTPLHPQPLLPGPRGNRSPMPASQYDAAAEWLARVNLSGTDERPYGLAMLARPKGESTQGRDHTIRSPAQGCAAP